MHAAESRPLNPAIPSPAPSGEVYRRAALRLAVFAVILASWWLVSLLGPTVIAAAGSRLDRFTGADRIAIPEPRAPDAAGRPARPIPLEWRWSPPGVDVDGMFRQRHPRDWRNR